MVKRVHKSSDGLYHVNGGKFKGLIGSRAQVMHSTVYKTKGGLYYAEAYLQMLSDSMTERLSDDVTPRFYNRQIAAIRFVPKEHPSKKTKTYIKKLKKRYV